MATTFEIVLPLGTPDPLTVGNAAFDLIDELEEQLTVYRESSEIVALNRLAPYRKVPVETHLFQLFQLAERIHRETAGAFDITAGALIKAWGFFRGPRRVPPHHERQALLNQVGMQHVRLDPGKNSVHYSRSGIEINLGAIGKGYALDRAVDRLRRDAGLGCFLVHGGFSSVYAQGNQPGQDGGWTIDLKHPWHPEVKLARLHLRNRGLGTSAATFQYLEHEGKKLGHILDPRTGWPASGMASCSVVAPTSAEADALSTAFFILGVEAAQMYCKEHPGIGAVLLTEEDNAKPIVVGLSPAECVLLHGGAARRPDNRDAS